MFKTKFRRLYFGFQSKCKFGTSVIKKINTPMKIVMHSCYFRGILTWNSFAKPFSRWGLFCGLSVSACLRNRRKPSIEALFSIVQASTEPKNYIRTLPIYKESFLLSFSYVLDQNWMKCRPSLCRNFAFPSYGSLCLFCAVTGLHPWSFALPEVI